MYGHYFLRFRNRKLRIMFFAELILLSSIFLFSSSCFRTQRDIMMEEDIKKIKTRQKTLKAEIDRKEKKLMDSDYTKSQDIDDVRTEIQMLSGKIDEVAFKNEKLIDKKISRFEGKIEALSREIADIKDEIKDIRSSGVRVAKKEEKKLTAKQIYNDAYKHYTAKKYKKSADGFAKLLKDFPKTYYRENALFFKASSHYNLSKYEEAILGYEEVVKGFPKSKKLPLVNLRQGICFEKIGSIEDAKYFYTQVAIKFPKSAEARQAKSRLLELKKTGKKRSTKSGKKKK